MKAARLVVLGMVISAPLMLLVVSNAFTATTAPAGPIRQLPNGLTGRTRPDAEAVRYSIQ
jgi:hypothetical protein